MKYMNDPMGIEEKSFEIIEEELFRTTDFCFEERELKIVKRIIHTTGDFDLAQRVVFKGGVIDSSLKALSQGCRIYVDTKMIRAGVNKKKLKQFGCELVNHISDEDVAEEAKRRGVTRSTVSIEKACRDSSIQGFIIGNAPTALFRVMELIEDGCVDPVFVFGVPVGFVGAEESKRHLLDLDVPSISIQGRKGGSPIGVAILNALFYMMDNRR